MRQQYETQHDLDNEIEIGNYLCQKWKCTMEKLPISYKVDFMFFQNSIPKALVEMRVRKIKHDQYADGVFMSLGKFTTGHQYSEILNIPFIFAVKFTDGLFVSKLEKGYSVKWGGRNQMRDSADREPVVMIPPIAFKLV